MPYSRPWRDTGYTLVNNCLFVSRFFRRNRCVISSWERRCPVYKRPRWYPVARSRSCTPLCLAGSGRLFLLRRARYECGNKIHMKWSDSNKFFRKKQSASVETVPQLKPWQAVRRKMRTASKNLPPATRHGNAPLSTRTFLCTEKYTRDISQNCVEKTARVSIFKRKKSFKLTKVFGWKNKKKTPKRKRADIAMIFPISFSKKNPLFCYKFSFFLFQFHIYFYGHSLTIHSIDWLIWLIDWLIARSIDLIDSFFDWLIDLIGWLIDWLIDWWMFPSRTRNFSSISNCICGMKSHRCVAATTFITGRITGPSRFVLSGRRKKRRRGKKMFKKKSKKKISEEKN